jgi:hypothetical protein
MKLFGHILRGNEMSPAYKIMEFALTNPRGYSKSIGNPTCMIKIMKDDMKSVGLQLTVAQDLINLSLVKRTTWQKIVKAVVIARRIEYKDETVTEKDLKLLQEVKDIAEKTNMFRIQEIEDGAEETKEGAAVEQT